MLIIPLLNHPDFTPIVRKVSQRLRKDGTVTLRECNSTKQVRSSETENIAAVKNIVNDQENWEDICQRLSEVLSQSSED